MKRRSVLPFTTAVVLFATASPAQQSLPASYEAHMATVARVESMTQTDLGQLVSKAQAGEPEAQHALALVYERGRLVPRDESAALSWMRKSAEQGYVPAQEGMGALYRPEGPNPNRADAERWLHLAATEGDAEAQFWLGAGYAQSSFGVVDYREALKWLRKSAAQGLPDAQLFLAGMYEAGDGLPQSDETAARWYRKAADHRSGVSGVWEAEVQLAYMYRDGRLRRNDVEAYIWFTVVDSSVAPPIDDDIKWAAKHMTKGEIAQAQRMAEEWIRRHKPQPESVDGARAIPN